MRLINTRTLKLEEVNELDRPPYAILSHTWGKDEVLFEDWPDFKRRRSKYGYRKISLACRQAKKDKIGHLWVDTCCINKTSSAELSEAINSMYAWYRDSVVCYAYMEDVSGDKLNHSRWFTRGWTLQELLAPKRLVFYNGGWERIGDKRHLAIGPLRILTGISTDYLRGAKSVAEASVAERLGWVSRRRTTRTEDLAYCMLGIFDINMPLLYGEGAKAFIRLQEEIIRVSNDQSIFSWGWNDDVPRGWASMLAPSPAAFIGSKNCWSPPQNHRRPVTYSYTNAGLSIRLPIIKTWSYYLALLDVQQDGIHIAIPLQGCLKTGVLRRVAVLDGPVQVPQHFYSFEYDAIIPRNKVAELFAVPRQPLGSCGMLVCFEGVSELISSRSYPPDSFDAVRSIFQFKGDGKVVRGFLKVKVRTSGLKDFVIYFAHLRGKDKSEPQRPRFVVKTIPDRFTHYDDVRLAAKLDSIMSTTASGAGYTACPTQGKNSKGLNDPPGSIPTYISPIKPFPTRPCIAMAMINLDGSHQTAAMRISHHIEDWRSDIAQCEPDIPSRENRRY